MTFIVASFLPNSAYIFPNVCGNEKDVGVSFSVPIPDLRP